MKIHTLKTINPHFEDLKSGKKTFELRLNDRDFQIGDKIICLEYVKGIILNGKESNGSYSGLGVTFTIQHILFGGEYGLDKEYVILSLEPGHDIKI